MNKLIPLRIYSYYDFLNSTISLERYIEFLKKNNINIASLVSQETVFGIYEFLKLTKKNKIKPLIGVTFSNLEINNRIIEITCFPKNFNGYKNMNFLSSISMNEENRKINLEEFKNLYKDLIFIISLDKNINLNNFFEIKKEFSFVLDDLYWGKNNKTNIDLFDEICFKNKIIDFKSIRILNNDEKELLINIKRIKNIKHLNINKENIFSFFESFKNYNEKEIVFFKKNQNELISKIDLKIPDIKYLRINKISNLSNEKLFEKLKLICFNKLKELHLFKNKQYIFRLNKELEIVKEKKFSNYFLIVKEYVDFAKKKEILTGPGRGSSPGSLICFLLEITKIDPIKYDLLFERFLNHERKELPDIDIDFEDIKRDLIIKHIQEKYNKKNVGLISTFQRIGIKLSIRDIGRSLGIEIIEINRIIKDIPKSNNENLDFLLKKSLKLKYWKGKYPKLFEFSNKIIGFPRQHGIHASGLVISDINLKYLTGTWNDSENLIIQMDMKNISDFGLIKMDILGLKNLTIISNILDHLNIKKNKNYFLSNINLEDTKIFKTLSNGETTGIFQLESFGITNLIKEIKPKELEDITIAISLFRPGTIKYKDVFLMRKNFNKKYKNIIPEFDPILKKTYGLVIFQEQIIKMVQVFSGFSAERSEILRRAISKKNKVLFEVFKTSFFEKSKEKGYSFEIIDEVWTIIIQFVKYGFNRSHAVSYAFIICWMLYLRFNEFNIFFIELLNNVIGDETKTLKYLNIIKNKKIILNIPNINKNIFKYSFIDKNSISLPLIIIKKIGNVFLTKLEKKIEQEGKFLDIFDFIVKMIPNGLNENIYKNLVYSGALDSFNFSRTTMIKNFYCLNLYFKIIKKKDSNKVNFSIIEKPKIKLFEDNKEEIKQKQIEILGFSI